VDFQHDEVATGRGGWILSVGNRPSRWIRQNFDRALQVIVHRNGLQSLEERLVAWHSAASQATMRQGEILPECGDWRFFFYSVNVELRGVAHRRPRISSVAGTSSPRMMGYASDDVVT
jgi:hypothetical protein